MYGVSTARGRVARVETKGHTMTQKALTARLATEEKTIENGLQTFVEVGMALTRIRDQKLWMAGGKHPSFEAYCKTRWGWNKSYAYQVAQSASVVKRIEDSAIAEKTPLKESQARPLAKLPEDEQPEAWAEAVEESKAEGRPVTAAKVGEVVARRLKPEEEEDWKPVESQPELAIDPDSIEAAQAGLDELKAMARKLANRAREVFRVEKQEITAPWLSRQFSWHGAVGTINEYVRMLDDNRPVGGTAKKPETNRTEKARKALEK